MQRIFFSSFVSLFLFLLPFSTFAALPNDPFFSNQWYLEKIHAPSAWDLTTGSDRVIVAVLDTGFDLDHPDLMENVWKNAGEVEADGIDNDHNGYIDDVYGYDFVDQDGNPLPNQQETFDASAVAHGTVIAGIIGAVGNNAEGIAGINWNVKLMSVRILNNEGSGNSAAAREGILYAVANGANVINLSFTGLEIDPAFKDALHKAYDAGIVVVAAVGNTHDGGINVDTTPIYPACHGEEVSEDWVIGVAASGPNDTKSIFSNYGALCTDISAPGENIFSTTYQDSTWTPFQKYYASGWSGTSVAVPMVAGAAALLKSTYPSITPAQMESILRLSADPVIATGDAVGKVGAGRLNIQNAFTIASSFVPAPILAAGEVASNSLIKRACSGQTNVDDPCRTVYFYSTDGKRHAFTNEKVFFTWFSNYDSVKEVSATFLSSLPLGKNVTYHPGTKMVKFQSVPTVYAVSKGGVLRPIVTEQVAFVLYGTNWNTQIDDISDAFFGNYRFGAKVTVPADYDVAKEKASVTGLNENFPL
ncbi:MAG: S8 family peptidase [Patescibacteria group bacterium]